MPISKVEVEEPIALNARIVDVAEECICINVDSLPHRLLDWLDSNNGEVEADLIETDNDRAFATREVQVTIVLFSIIMGGRSVAIPAFDCVPSKNCIASTEGTVRLVRHHRVLRMRLSLLQFEFTAPRKIAAIPPMLIN